MGKKKKCTYQHGGIPSSGLRRRHLLLQDQLRENKKRKEIAQTATFDIFTSIVVSMQSLYWAEKYWRGSGTKNCMYGLLMTSRATSSSRRWMHAYIILQYSTVLGLHALLRLTRVARQIRACIVTNKARASHVRTEPTWQNLAVSGTYRTVTC
jgi:hypothetical protein